MIHWFEVENFTSFVAPTRIDFTPGKVVDDYSVATSPSGIRLSKLVGVFGPNAAGKTNLIRALSRTADFISESFNWPESTLLPFKPHFFGKDKPARVALQFELPADEGSATPVVYRYEIEANEQQVVRERLRVRTSQLFSRVFERELSGKTYKITGLGSRFRDVPERISFVSWLARHEMPEARRIASYFKRYQTNEFGVAGRVPLLVGMWAAIDAYRHDPRLHRDMLEVLRRWDLGVADVRYVSTRVAGNEQETWEAIVTHRRGEKSAELPMVVESSGTVGLFAQLSVLLQVLREGGVCVMDEIESDLHPDMVEMLLDLFIDPETNPKQAQLIFTTHADWVMNLLNRWTTVLVEKRECASTAWRLCDMQGIQSRDNHAAKYRSGAYGAVPRDLREDCEATW